eukprot:CAMPEP_0117755050 /NCGR_PEP_ID=MMETSP0947-20121206/13212_1 /TAXON_ID=44440 /ORGANISM="Chattonella subsalsa, Strain CCMP2191" /LENGTH=84 /DNA_ID=CAMNT_0005574293 /DNA_START=502 /DNA_END=756 /DNA_ORIENTATION=-
MADPAIDRFTHALTSAFTFPALMPGKKYKIFTIQSQGSKAQPPKNILRAKITSSRAFLERTPASFNGGVSISSIVYHIVQITKT